MRGCPPDWFWRCYWRNGHSAACHMSYSFVHCCYVLGRGQPPGHEYILHEHILPDISPSLSVRFFAWEKWSLRRVSRAHRISGIFARNPNERHQGKTLLTRRFLCWLFSVLRIDCQRLGDWNAWAPILFKRPFSSATQFRCTVCVGVKIFYGIRTVGQTQASLGSIEILMDLVLHGEFALHMLGVQVRRNSYLSDCSLDGGRLSHGILPSRKQSSIRTKSALPSICVTLVPKLVL